MMILIKFKSFVATVFFTVMLLFLSCHGETVVKREPAKEHGGTKAYTSAYVCPLHCAGSGSDRPGTCIGCGIDYVPLSEHNKNGHTH